MRLASKPAQPRSWISLPGYPTLAAAGLSLCLAGCGAGGLFGGDPAGSPPYCYRADAAPQSDVLLPPLAQDACAPDVGAIASAPIDGGSDAGTGAFDSAPLNPDPGNPAGGEPYPFIPELDAGNQDSD